MVGKGHAEFQSGRQQDAMEYFLYVLDKIKKAEQQAKAADPGKTFEYEMEKRIQCSTCNKVKYSTFKDSILNIQAPVDSKVPKGTAVELSACLERYFGDQVLDDVFCSSCAKKSQFTQRFRFVRYPKTLCMALQRFVFDDWVPKKLEVELQVNGPVDLEAFKSANQGQPLPGEEVIQEVEVNEDEEVEPELKADVLNLVLQMGIPEIPAKHALYRSGNSDADAAVTWYFSNMEDPAIQVPLRVKNKPKAGGDDAPAGLVSMMAEMGLPEKLCKRALKNCDNNVERAIEWAFSHMDDPEDGEDEPMENQETGADLSEQYSCTKPGIYNLQSFVTHLGASVHAGHYVCHVHKNEAENSDQQAWIYFNDAKVAKTDDPPVGKGYLYFLTKA